MPLCPTCSAAIFEATPGGRVSVHKVATRAREAVNALEGACDDPAALRRAKAAVSSLADAANLMAARAAHGGDA